MPINCEALASSIAGLAELSAAKSGLEQTLELVVKETDRIFAVDGAGLMLLTEGDVLRYVTASDDRGRILESLQEGVGEGPCLDAFERDLPTVAVDVTTDQRWPSLGRMAREHGIRAVLGVPVGLGNGPVGTLNVYSTRRHDWDQGEVDAIQAYARIVASVLRTAIDAHLKGRIAEQLQYALDHRVVVEQAKGILMEREGVDQRMAFELLRQRARADRRRVVDLARSIVAGESLKASQR